MEKERLGSQQNVFPVNAGRGSSNILVYKKPLTNEKRSLKIEDQVGNQSFPGQCEGKKPAIYTVKKISKRLENRERYPLGMADSNRNQEYLSRLNLTIHNENLFIE